MKKSFIYQKFVFCLFIITILVALSVPVSAGIALTVEPGCGIRPGEQYITIINGEPSTSYWVFITNCGLTEEKYPKIIFDNSNIYQDNPDEFKSAVGSLAPLDPTTDELISGSWCKYITGTDGTGQIKWSTDVASEGNTFQFRAISVNDTTQFDVSKGKVEKRAVSITISGDGSYYDYETLVVSGTNTASYITYLFITGPNLPSNGARLDLPSVSSITGDDTTFAHTEVKSDNTWEYRFYPENLNLVSGEYEIYGVSEPKSKSNLNDAKYGMTSFILKSTATQTITPTITATPTPTVTFTPTSTTTSTSTVVSTTIPTTTITQTITSTPTYDIQSDVEDIKKRTKELEEKTLTLEERLTKQETLVELIMNWFNSIFG